jgi:hypothetical protein
VYSTQSMVRMATKVRRSLESQVVDPHDALCSGIEDVLVAARLLKKQYRLMTVARRGNWSMAITRLQENLLGRLNQLHDAAGDRRRFAVPLERSFVKIIKRIVVAGILVLAGGVVGWWVHEWRLPASRPPVSEIESGPSLEQIQTLSSLTTLKVNVADAIVTDLDGRTGGIKCVLVVHGSVTLGVDLSKARFESVDQRNRRVILMLPPPRVQSVALDQKRTKVMALCENGLWTIVPGNGEAYVAAANLAYREAEKVVAEAAQDPELGTRAQQQTEFVIRSFFQAIEWQNDLHWINF